jgi:alpha-tubulin N-acetyltransferase 1
MRMEHPYLAALVPSDGSPGVRISRWTARAVAALSGKELATLRGVVDLAGAASSAAQGLAQPVTVLSRLMQEEEQVVYLASRRGASGGTVLVGLLKLGAKRLFVLPARSATLVEVRPMCVLDFYVHETQQRSGWGRLLFHTALATEGLSAEALAYDRPSGKLLGFLRKHHGLESYVTQANAYVVFEPGFWLVAQHAQARAAALRNLGKKDDAPGARGQVEHVAAARAIGVSSAAPVPKLWFAQVGPSSGDGAQQRRRAGDEPRGRGAHAACGA